MLLIIGLLGIFSLTGGMYALAGKQMLGARQIVIENQGRMEEALPLATDLTPPGNEKGAGEVSQIVSEAAVVSPLPAEVAKEIAPSPETGAKNSYPLHKNITATHFWVGEQAGEENKHISNLPSAWDEAWVKHYGGVDDPKKRSGYFPANFNPKENPFYVALPYNDFGESGDRRKEVYSLIPWAKNKKWKDDESMLKNQWVKIMKNGTVAYAQWQDVGPFKEDDAAYVFGTALPKSKINKRAGIDVSPAVNQMLGLADIDTVDWQFVDAQDVPDGPWKKVVTTSQVYWK